MTTDKQKEEDRRTRIQHPHIIKSKAHWDWESGYSEYDESADDDSLMNIVYKNKESADQKDKSKK